MPLAIYTGSGVIVLCVFLNCRWPFSMLTTWQLVYRTTIRCSSREHMVRGEGGEGREGREGRIVHSAVCIFMYMYIVYIAKNTCIIMHSR